MKTVSANLDLHLSRTVTTLTACWRLVLDQHHPEVTNVNQATANDPTIVTTRFDHGLLDGQYVQMADMSGMAQLAATFHEILVTSATTFELVDQQSWGYTPYVSGGRARRALGFTEFDKDLIVDGLLYEADTGHRGSGIDLGADLSVDTMEVDGVLDSEKITEADVLNGRYDYADVEVFVVNYNSLADGKVSWKVGVLGEVSVDRNLCKAEVRGLTQHLEQDTISAYTPYCKAKLGDAKCRVDTSLWEVAGTVSTVNSLSIFVDAGRAEADGHWSNGLLTWTSGNNLGKTVEVRAYGGGSFEMYEQMWGAIEVGDTYIIIPGCDGRLATCNLFGNHLNFRGFPHIPGMIRYLDPGAEALPVGGG